MKNQGVAYRSLNKPSTNETGLPGNKYRVNTILVKT
jgi:hypothetical protein